MKYLDALPRPLRWALFLPVGLAGAIVVDWVLNAAFSATGPTFVGSMKELGRAAMSAFIWAFIPTFVCAVVSPRPWVVGLVMFAITLIVRVGPIISAMMVPYQRMRLQAQMIAVGMVIGVHVFGGIVALYLIREVTSPRSLPSKPTT
jgi:hypothetical protein